MDAVTNQVGLDEIAKMLRLNRRLPISDQIYDVLRDSIVTLRLMPGASISESSLCKLTGASRTPVRAVLQRLTEEGLIDVFPQQGSFVSLISLRSIRDSHFIRCALESAILRAAAKKWTPEHSAGAREVLRLQEEAISLGEFDRFHEEDDRFHRLFAVYADLDGVLATVQATKARLTRFYRLFGKPTRLPAVPAEHCAIVDALDANDADLAVQRLEDHLNKIFDILRQLPEAYQPYLTD
jgi:DNA-binding GntR family transcriptional regulator